MVNSSTILVNDIQQIAYHQPTEAVEVDAANLAIGDSIHLSDVTLPNEVTLVTHDEADPKLSATMP